MKDFNNKVIVITGAGSGIGRALAVAFAAAGAKLALNDFNPVTLKETAQLLNIAGDKLLLEAFDVSNREAIFSFATSVVQHFGVVDMLINNAGIGIGDYPFEESNLDLFEKVMHVNFNGVLYGSKAFIPYLKQRPEAALVNISSVFGLTGIAYSAAYCASKFAVYGLNQCLIQEYKNTNLTVHSVHPGGINTNIAKNAIDYNETHDAFHKEFLKLSPDYAAKVIIAGIKKKKNRILIGAEAKRLDLAVRFAPIGGGRVINKIIQEKVLRVRKG